MLSIKNFGSIKEANLNISPLTIFIGPNSSGKSFSAALIHSILNSFNNLGLNRYKYIRNKSVELFLENDDEISKEFKDSLMEYVNSKPKVSDNPFKFSTEKFRIILKQSFGIVLSELIEEKLHETFNSNLDNLNRLHKYPFEFSFNDNKFLNKDGSLNIEDFHVDMNNVKNEGLSSENKNICFFGIDDDFLFIHLNYLLWDNFFEGNEKLFVEVMFMMIVSSVMDAFNQNSYYIPAAGDELFKNINAVISDDVSGNLKHSLVQKELLMNFLKVKDDINQSPFYELTEMLEKEIIGGNIKFKKGDIKDEFVFIDRENNLELELGLTSSSIRELMPLIIYFKYFLKKDDTLIIEEPENHIHPKNQLVLVKYLVKAINMGLNIIITTHSDFIIEQFNNFIRLAKSNQKTFEKLGYDESMVLDFHDVSIYNFKQDDIYGYVASSVEINETGFDEDSLYEVHSQLYDESVDIMGSLISMLENLIKDYFSKFPFDDKKCFVFENNCEDDGCKLSGHFNDYIVLNGDKIKECLKKDEKSVDRIIILNEDSKGFVDVVLCELTLGEKKYTDVVGKIKKSGEYILNVLKTLGFKVRKFKCVFVGKYKNAKRLTQKPFSIPGSNKNNLTIQKLNCGSEFSKIK